MTEWASPVHRRTYADPGALQITARHCLTHSTTKPYDTIILSRKDVSRAARLITHSREMFGNNNKTGWKSSEAIWVACHHSRPNC